MPPPSVLGLRKIPRLITYLLLKYIGVILGTKWKRTWKLLQGNEGVEKKMETTTLGYTVWGVFKDPRLHSWLTQGKIGLILGYHALTTGEPWRGRGR